MNRFIGIFSNNIAPNVKKINVPLGHNMVINGGFDTNTDWTLGANFSIVGGLLHASGATSTSYATQSGRLTVGKKYRVTFTVLNWTSDAVRIYLGSSVGANRNANGTYTQDITCYLNGDISFYNIGSDPHYDIDNVIIQEIKPNIEDYE